MARRRSRFIRPPVKTKIWIGAGVGPLTVIASTARTLSNLNANALLLRPFTILRTRLVLGIQTDQESAAEDWSGDFGLIVVSEPASSIGVTAIPTPLSETNADWFVHQPLMFSFAFITGAGFDGQKMTQYIVDSKAMRKVGPNDQVVGLVEPRSATGAIITMEGRMLVQLH